MLEILWVSVVKSQWSSMVQLCQELWGAMLGITDVTVHGALGTEDGGPAEDTAGRSSICITCSCLWLASMWCSWRWSHVHWYVPPPWAVMMYALCWQCFWQLQGAIVFWHETIQRQTVQQRVGPHINLFSHMHFTLSAHLFTQSCTFTTVGSAGQRHCGIVIPSWHWYESSVGEGKWESVGMLEYEGSASCRSYPGDLAHVRRPLTNLSIESANPLPWWLNIHILANSTEILLLNYGLPSDLTDSRASCSANSSFRIDIIFAELYCKKGIHHTIGIFE